MFQAELLNFEIKLVSSSSSLSAVLQLCLRSLSCHAQTEM